jgi:RimJ/RimL family protein N-acetyltransferase
MGAGAGALSRIVSMIRAENTASRRVAGKVGMTVEREATWGELPREARHDRAAHGRGVEERAVVDGLATGSDR